MGQVREGGNGLGVTVAVNEADWWVLVFFGI